MQKHASAAESLGCHVIETRHILGVGSASLTCGRFHVHSGISKTWEFSSKTGQWTMKEIAAQASPLQIIKGFSGQERTIFITHGYGHWLTLSALSHEVLPVDRTQSRSISAHFENPMPPSLSCPDHSIATTAIPANPATALTISFRSAVDAAAAAALDDELFAPPSAVADGPPAAPLPPAPPVGAAAPTSMLAPGVIGPLLGLTFSTSWLAMLSYPKRMPVAWLSRELEKGSGQPDAELCRRLR